eukprot:2033081-Rhodomonas_salina.1
MVILNLTGSRAGSSPAPYASSAPHTEWHRKRAQYRTSSAHTVQYSTVQYSEVARGADLGRRTTRQLPPPPRTLSRPSLVPATAVRDPSVRLHDPFRTPIRGSWRRSHTRCQYRTSRSERVGR